MSFRDKSIQCSGCGATFTFSAGEQEFFTSKGLSNEPKRFVSCRAAKKHSATEMVIPATNPDPGDRRPMVYS